jgi:predicted DCC family thiol-disulfide oxidoreductase YuxK
MFLVKFFWSYFYYPGTEIFKKTNLNSEKIWLLVRLFYVSICYVAFEYFQRGVGGYPTAPYDPLWPASLVRIMDFVHAKHIYLIFFLISSIAVLINPQKRLFRIFAFIGLLTVSGLYNSYGKIGHSDHHLMFATFGLIFLDKDSSLKNVIFFLSIQALLLITYSLSGFWKLIASTYQVFFDYKSSFHPDAMAEQVAHEFLTSGYLAPISSYIFRFKAFFMVVLNLGIYLELYSLWILFKPRLHLFWGLLLLSLHIGTYLTVHVGFTYPTFVIGAFFVCSPFQKKATMKEILFDMPWFGTIFLILYTRLRKASETIVFYDGECGVCDNLVQTLLKKSKVKNFYAPLYGDTYKSKLLGDEDVDLSMNDSFYVQVSFENFDVVLKGSQAFFYVISHTEKLRILSILVFIPSIITDVGYYFFSSVRKKIAKSLVCGLPTMEDRKYLLS